MNGGKAMYKLKRHNLKPKTRSLSKISRLLWLFFADEQLHKRIIGHPKDDIEACTSWFKSPSRYESSPITNIQLGCA